LESFKSFTRKLYSVNDTTFQDIALELFQFQASANPIYREFIKHLGLSVSEISSVGQIPYLPISFFKTHLIQTEQWVPETIFTSSGTTKNGLSRHAVPDLQFYLRHAVRCFEHFFGPVTNYHFLALLPSYLERQGSSLIAMMDYFMRQSNSEDSAFYLNDYPGLVEKLRLLKNDSRKTILWGVSFALLDLAEKYALDLGNCLVFETGGMKGKRREITKNEMREVLKAKINVKSLFSEYGMTELLSQAYAIKGLFQSPPWMKILVRDETDPLSLKVPGQTSSGAINVIDLANIYSCSFIATDDVGRLYSNGSFEVLGRMDNSDIRGCSLLAL